MTPDCRNAPPIVVIIEGNESSISLHMLALIAHAQVTNQAPYVITPPEIDVDAILELMPPIVTRNDFGMFREKNTRSKSKQERRKARGWA